MSKTDAIKKAQRKASSPEARAKAVATMKRRREEALLAHAKMVTGDNKDIGYTTIPLDMIPDREPKPRKKWTKKTAKGVPPAKGVTRQEVVLALLRYLNGE